MGEALKDRVQARNGTGGEVAKREGSTTLAQQIKGMEQQFQLAMPKGMEAAQIIRDALTALRTTKNLAQCEATSVLGALMTCSQLGLRPGVLGHAWVLPFWDNRARGYKAQLVIGYQGLVELAHRSGRIESLIARTVYANDPFDVEYGLSDKLLHKPTLKGSRGEPVAYYAVVKYKGGGHAFFVMTHDEMAEYRDRYATAKTKEGKLVGPWRDNFEGMALKTTVRQLAKWMPKSTELASAIEADGTVRLDLTPNPDAMLHGEHPETLDGEVVEVDTSHDAGHGQMVAWSPDCQECAENKAGEAHFQSHAEPEESCWHCQREAAWRTGTDA